MSTRKRTFNHGDKETRLRNANERLGTENPSCLLGHKVSPHALQLHHVAEEEFDDETVILCSNHHDPVSDAQKDHPRKIPDSTNPLESIGHMSLGLGEMVAVILEDQPDHPLREFLTYLRWKLQEIGTVLIEYARRTPNDDFGGVS